MYTLNETIRHQQITELLVILTGAEDDVKNNRIAHIKDTFDDLRSIIVQNFNNNIVRKKLYDLENLSVSRQCDKPLTKQKPQDH